PSRLVPYSQISYVSFSRRPAAFVSYKCMWQSMRSSAMGLTPARLVADLPEELEHGVCAEVSRHAGRDVEERVDLHQVEAHHLGVRGDGGEKVAKLAIRHAVRLGGDAARDER